MDIMKKIIELLKNNKIDYIIENNIIILKSKISLRNNFIEEIQITKNKVTIVFVDSEFIEEVIEFKNDIEVLNHIHEAISISKRLDNFTKNQKEIAI